MYTTESSAGLRCFAVLADRWQVILGEFPGRCTQCAHSATTWPLFHGIEYPLPPNIVHFINSQRLDTTTVQICTSQGIAGPNSLRNFGDKKLLELN